MNVLVYICKILCKPYISNKIFILQYLLIEAKSGFGEDSERLIYKKKCQSASISYYTKMTRVIGCSVGQSTILMYENGQKFKKKVQDILIKLLFNYDGLEMTILPFIHRFSQIGKFHRLLK